MSGSTSTTGGQRLIGRWTIGETLGKGGYSFVKKGKDIKTGKIVALKFMEKADTSWAKEQAIQVETEIEALKAVRHRNIMKLYAYNLNAQYPSKTKGAFIDTVLLVLEFAPGGELFDILYYTKSLDEKICRTYFHQIVSGVQACHNAGVIHRDLKPQNLLLDSNYNIKITDFGLSKIVSSDSDAVMTTTYVGTKGYQAPELLRDEPYDLKCDVFSVGVILFILLAGYPPFEQATKADKWFRSLHKKNYEKFWKAHHKCPIVKKEMGCKGLFQSMLKSYPKERCTMEEIRTHAWMDGPVIKPAQLIPVLRERHRMAEERRRKDVRKMTDLAVSVNPNRAIPGLEEAGVDFFPEHLTESVLDIYTWGKWTDVYNGIEEWVPDRVQGSASYDFDLKILECQANVLNNEVTEQIVFTIKVFESREWSGKAPAEVVEQNADLNNVYVVRATLISGDRLIYNKIKESFLLQHCSTVLKGLPAWALKEIKHAANATAEATAATTTTTDDQKEDANNNNNCAADAAAAEEPVDDYDSQLVNDAELWAVTKATLMAETTTTNNENTNVAAITVSS